MPICSHASGSGSSLQKSLHAPVPDGHSPSLFAATQTLEFGSWHGYCPLLNGVRHALQRLGSGVIGDDGVSSPGFCGASPELWHEVKPSGHVVPEANGEQIVLSATSPTCFLQGPAELKLHSVHT